jgi:hypothetical protein
MAPDLSRPSGGVRTIYRSVDLLNAAGIPAAVVHARKGFRCSWFDNTTSIVYPLVRLGARDVLVPPAYLYFREPSLAPGVRKVIFNQGAYRTFSYSRGRAGSVGASLKNADVVGMLAVSEDNMRYLEHAFPGVAIARMHHWIDPAVFRVDVSARRRKIAVMPKRRRDVFEQLIGILTAREVLVGWELEVLEGLPEHEVAARLRESVLFISLSKADGFGLPPAEAMASGCHVIGFHGMGGREIFRPPFALAIEDGDVLALAIAVEEFLVSYEQRTAELERLAIQGAEFIASTYSRECATEDLRRVFQPLVQSDGGEAEAVISRRDLSYESPLWAAVQARVLRVGRRLLQHSAR